MKTHPILAAAEAATIYFSSGEPVRIQAAAQADAPPPFDMIAYTGGTLKVKGFPLPVVVDLRGLEGTDRPRPVLRDHDQAKAVGHTEAIVNDGMRLTASGVMSGKNQITKETIDAAKDNFPWQSSIGADPLALKLVKAGEKVRVNGREFEGPVIVATRSRLREISFVAIGADDGTSAKIAASAADKESVMTFAEWLKSKGFDESTLNAASKQFLTAQYEAEIQAKGGAGDGGDASDDEEDARDTDQIIADSLKAQRVSAAAETKRIAAVTKACGGKFPAIEAKAIEEGWTVDKTELEVLRADRPKAPAGFVVGKEIGGAVLEAALCMSLGIPDVEKQFKPEVLEAAHKKRNIGLQETLMLTACANGYAGSPGERVHPGNLRDVLEFAFPRGQRGRTIEAGFSTIALPGIFSNVANKELLTGYMEEDQTWREVAQVKSVNDFKQVTSYRLLDDMEYEELAPDGRIAHGKLGEESYTRQAKTYAKMFALSRTNIINDDLGAFEDLRRRLGAGAAKKFNNIFWAKFLANSGVLHAGRGNYLTGSTTTLLVDGVGLEAGLTKFRQLRSPVADGEKRLGNTVGGRPDRLLVPPELEFAAERLYQSTQVNTGGAATAETVGNTNIHAGKYRPIVCDWLSDADFTGYSATAWYLLRNPAQLAAVVASFLNGQQSPTVESTDADFDQLGIQFRGYHDFGVDQAEYLCGIKSKGAA
jgi:phage major head subunit gpT-like protein